MVYLKRNILIMDIWEKNKISEVMSKIRSQNTKPEIALRKALFTKGYRYRINDKRLPGKPDIVLPKYKTAIFVHGCFWHGHEKEDCSDSHIPKTNTAYWNEKITRNKDRDKRNNILLKSMGWKVITVWDCEIQQKGNMENIIRGITHLLNQPVPAYPKDVSIKFYEEVEGNITMVAKDIVPYKKDKS